MKEPSRFLLGVVALSIEAGQKILDIYHSDFRVAHKEDDSPLTAADLVAHQCLQAGLQALKPVYPVLSEESAEVPFEERCEWETYWLIDPLDGTREFVKRNGEFTVNIALIHRHKPVLGVVYAPVVETCYFAVEGGGAFRKTKGGEPEPICARQQAPQRPVVVGSRSHRTPELDAYLARLGTYELKSIGSSLKFCLVAEGAADLYPRMGPTSEWDTAAAHCIVEAAGGAVTDLHGKPLLYNAKASLLNPNFLAFGDKRRNWASCAEDLGLRDSGDGG